MASIDFSAHLWCWLCSGHRCFRGGGEPEYGVVFDQQTTLGLRWLCESELCPILNGSVRSTRGEES